MQEPALPTTATTQRRRNTARLLAIVLLATEIASPIALL